MASTKQDRQMMNDFYFWYFLDMQLCKVVDICETRLQNLCFSMCESLCGYVWMCVCVCVCVHVCVCRYVCILPNYVFAVL